MYRTTLLSFLLLICNLLPLAVPAPAHAQSADDFLLPDQAFKISGKGNEGNKIAIQWDVADGYYLYQSKFKFSSNTPGIELGSPIFPPSETKHDDFFGEMEVHRNLVEIEIPVEHEAAGTIPIEIAATYQGCADAGLCYPPQTRKLSIELSANDYESSGDPLAALGELGQTLGLGEIDEILPVEEAYQLVANVESGQEIRLHWTIADGTYLYQDQIRVQITKGQGVKLGEVTLPEAKIKENTIRADGTFGDLPVYEHEIDLQIPLQRSTAEPTEIEMLVTYQGCAEAGICYPPVKKEIALALPKTSEETIVSKPADSDTKAGAPEPTAAEKTPLGATAPQVTAASQLSEQDRIAATLAGGNTWLILLTFFGFGLLLSLTPCVFPMIPILSGIIAGQGTNITTQRAFSLSLIYVLAMSITYTLAGVLAGLFGQNLQAAFQNPWVLSLFALVFVLLALSMFGFYELQLPSRWQSRLAETSNRQKGGSYTGVAIMGLLSALIVGPCVAPPLAGALIYIGQSGDAVLGGLGLFALSMGMGAPLLAIGTSAGKILPRAGAWMDTIKAVFGVGMLAVAIIMLERIVPPAIAMVLWGILMVVSSIYMGALQQLPVEASGWDRLWRGLGCVLLIYGALMLVGAAAGGKDTVQPLRGLGFSATGSGGNITELHFKRIKNVADLNKEIEASSRAGKPIMLDFYADWCVTCKEMERYTFSDPKVIKALEAFTLLQADVTADDDEDRALLQGHFGMPGPPSIMFYDRAGNELYNLRIVGFMPAEAFAAHVQRADQ